MSRNIEQLREDAQRLRLSCISQGQLRECGYPSAYFPVTESELCVIKENSYSYQNEIGRENVKFYGLTLKVIP